MKMELLQSCRYKEKPDYISEFYLQELYMQIDLIIELCKEGEFSAFEAATIIFNEEDSCRDFQFDLIKMLTNLENGTAPLPSSCTDDDHKEMWIKIFEDNILSLMRDIDKYESYLSDVLNKLSKLFDSNDYQEKRKLKIKQSIIQDGISSLTKKYQNSFSKTTKDESPNIYESKFNSSLPDNHVFMKMLKDEYPNAYTVVKIGIEAGIIEFKNSYFNFKCDKGCVGLIFYKAGCNVWKTIGRYILIDNEKPAENTLKNCTKNTEPKEWERIKTILFPTTPK